MPLGGKPFYGGDSPNNQIMPLGDKPFNEALAQKPFYGGASPNHSMEAIAQNHSTRR